MWLATCTVTYTNNCHKQWISTWLWPLFELRRRRRTAYAYQPIPQDDDVVIAGSHVQGGYGYGSGRFSHSVTKELCQQVSQEYGEYDWKTQQKTAAKLKPGSSIILIVILNHWTCHCMFFSLAVLYTYLYTCVFGIQQNVTCHNVMYSCATYGELWYVYGWQHTCTPCYYFQYRCVFVTIWKACTIKWN